MKCNILDTRMRSKVLLLFAFSFLIVSKALAAPSVSSVSGTISDGQTVTVSGSSFSSNSAVGTSKLEFIGGAGGPIESGTVGAPLVRANWDADWAVNDSLASDSKHFATDQYHSGAKSLKTTVLPATKWNGAMSYRLPTASSSLFFSHWVRHDTGVTDGQWKMLRLSLTNTVVDGQAIVFSTWPGVQSYATDTIASRTLWVPESSYPAMDNKWYRMDYWINGSAITTTRWQPGGAKVTAATTGWTSRNWAYLVWQDYVGNSQTKDTTATNIWHDDVFVQADTQARIEVCDASTWANSKQCEIQYPTSWSNTSANIKFNKGSLSGTAYLYVIDANGAASNGQQIVIGSVGVSQPPAPKNLIVK